MKKRNQTREDLVNEFLKILDPDNPTLFWKKGWKMLDQERNTSGKQYNGINKMYLNLVADRNGFEDNRWFTFNQVKSLNEKGRFDIKVRKGEKSHKVEYWYCILKKSDEFDSKIKLANSTIGRPTQSSSGCYNKIFTFDEMRKICRENPNIFDRNDFYSDFRSFNVFNGDRIEGIERKKTTDIEYTDENVKFAEKLVSNYVVNMGMEVRSSSSGSAYYDFYGDDIVIPSKDAFASEEDYISTLLHEICHSTGRKDRLDRSEDMKNYHFDEEIRAKEEFVAEISSTFLCNELGINMSDDHIRNHVAYVKSWSEAISDRDKGEKVLMDAIKQSDKIIDFFKDNSDYKHELAERQTVQSSKDASRQIAGKDENPQKGKTANFQTDFEIAEPGI